MKSKKMLAACLTAAMMFGTNIPVSASEYTQNDYPSQWTFANGRVVTTFFDENGNFVGREAGGQIVRLVGSSVVHLPNSYNGGLASEAGIRNGRIQSEPTSQQVNQYEKPTLSSASPEVAAQAVYIVTEADMENQISTLLINAPEAVGTRSSITLPNRRLNESELSAWISEYEELGGMSRAELEIARLINAERAAHGLPLLAVDPVVMMVARFRSQEMADLNYFNHKSPVYEESFMVTRMFGAREFSEIIYRGSNNPPNSVRWWMNSQGHRSTILTDDSRAGSIGVGICGTIVTATFGWED
jgi:uncharacterized protein YkwD